MERKEKGVGAIEIGESQRGILETGVERGECGRGKTKKEKKGSGQKSRENEIKGKIDWGKKIRAEKMEEINQVLN